jgi:hypothetical protein
VLGARVEFLEQENFVSNWRYLGDEEWRREKL